MTLDGLTLCALIRELSAPLAGAKIEKINMPQKDEAILLLHTREGKKRLLLSASGSDPRLHLTAQQKPNPDKAFNFCMFLRKYLSGGRIEQIAQEGLERVVRMDIAAKDEMGIPCRYALYTEIMGKYSNIILVHENGKIMDSIKHISVDTSSKRQVLPGVRYELPPMDKTNPLEAGCGEIAAAVSGKNLPYGLVEALEGVSPQTAEELCARFFEETPALLQPGQAPGFAAFIRAYLEQALAHPAPCVQKNMAGVPVFLSLVPYAAYSEQNRQSFAAANEAVDYYYARRDFLQKLEQSRTGVMRVLKKNIARVEKKLKIQWETIQAAERTEKFRLYGELISANIYQLRRGMAKADLINYYTGESITVPLDVSLSPSANATKYFKKVTKLKNGVAIAEKQAAQYEQELGYLRELEYTAEAAQELEDLQEVRAELVRYGYLDLAPKEKITRSDPLEKPMEFLLSSGSKALAGRNSRQNDALTLHVAEDTDYWFHAKNQPGSHVILFTGGGELLDSDVIEAATIAATYCRGSKAGKVEIDYAPRKNVWKANGARPGMVNYDHYWSILVSPDAALADRLRRQ